MRVLYLGAHGPTNIRLTKDGLQIGDSEPTPPPEFEYDTILIGNTKGFVSYAALKALGKWGVTVGLMGRGGTPLSTFVPWARNDSPLRLAQMKAALDPKTRFSAARAFVEGKTGEKVPRAVKTMASLRNYEGRIADSFWTSVGVIRRSGYTKAQNYKATLPVCALINYAEGVSAVKCRAIIAKLGMDPAVGFLHSSWVDKDGFVFDSQELLRSVVDNAALELSRSLPPSAFVRDEDWVYRLTGETARLTALKVEETLNRKLPYEGERVPIEGVLTRELRHFGQWCRAPSPSLTFQTVRS